MSVLFICRGDPMDSAEPPVRMPRPQPTTQLSDTEHEEETGTGGDGNDLFNGQPGESACLPNIKECFLGLVQTSNFS